VMVCCSKAIIAKKPIHNKKALTTLITAFSVRAFAHEALSQPAESANDLSEAILLSTSSNTKRNSKAMAESASFLQSLYLRSAKVNLAMGQIKDAQRDCDVAEKLSPNRLNEICKIRNDALLRTSGDTPIQGVNTAGTFHAGNLANLEALLNISCWFMQFLGYGLAIVFLLDLIRTSPIHVQKRRRLLLRFALSVLFAATISHMVNFLICDARDVNLFY